MTSKMLAVVATVLWAGSAAAQTIPSTTSYATGQGMTGTVVTMGLDATARAWPCGSPNVQTQAVSSSNPLAGLLLSTMTTPTATGASGATAVLGVVGLGGAGAVVQIRACGS